MRDVLAASGDIHLRQSELRSRERFPIGCSAGRRNDVVQRRDRASLALEALAPPGVGRERCGKNLDGNVTVQASRAPCRSGFITSFTGPVREQPHPVLAPRALATRVGLRAGRGGPVRGHPRAGYETACRLRPCPRHRSGRRLRTGRDALRLRGSRVGIISERRRAKPPRRGSRDDRARRSAVWPVRRLPIDCRWAAARAVHLTSVVSGGARIRLWVWGPHLRRSRRRAPRSGS